MSEAEPDSVVPQGEAGLPPASLDEGVATEVATQPTTLADEPGSDEPPRSEDSTGPGHEPASAALRPVVFEAPPEPVRMPEPPHPEMLALVFESAPPAEGEPDEATSD